MAELFDEPTGALVYMVEDDPFLARAQKLRLDHAGFNCEIFESGEDVLASLERGALPHAVVLDLLMPGIGGLEALKRIRRIEPELPVIVVSGQEKVSIAVESIREGAYDYLMKPVGEEALTATVRHAVAQRKVALELARLRREVKRAHAFDRLIGRSDAMHKVFKLIERTLGNNITVLILGESGTGKELVARSIHYNGVRADKPFVVVNCAAIPRELVESELFGHEKGSFTGAIDRKIGKFEQANTGTLFLDEIGELELSVQAKLLRALQEREIERVGGKGTIKIDVRLVCATQRDLDREVEENRFREDLYYRINPYPILMPPLRDRRGEIELLAGYFLDKHAKALGREDIRGFSHAALQAMERFEWPGNVRQLENVVTRSMVLAERDVLTLNELPEAIRAKAPEAALELEVEALKAADYEESELASVPSRVADIRPLTSGGNGGARKAEWTGPAEAPSRPGWPGFATPDDVPAIEDVKEWVTRQAYEACGRNISLTAKKLGLGRATLYRQLEKYDIHLPRGPEGEGHGDSE